MATSLIRNAALGAFIAVILAIYFGNIQSTRAEGINLVANPSVETASTSPSSLPLSWYKGGYGANTRVLNYPVAGFDGAKALRVEVTAYTGGDAKWFFEPVKVSGGQQLTIRDSYRSNIPSTVALQYKLADGTYKYPDIAVDLPASADWTAFSKTFTVPTNYGSPVVDVTVFHLIQKAGWLETDAFNLTDDSGAGTTTPPTGTTTPPTSDSTPPSISLDPVPNQPVSGTITLTASSSDNTAVAGVQFFLDGAQLGSMDTTAPYSAQWNTASGTNGSHAILARARDAAGNAATSSPLNVSVSNTTSTSTGTTTPPTGTTTPPVSPNNLIANPSLETASSQVGLPLSWLKGGYGTNTRILSYPVAGFDGAKAIRNEITAYASGDSKWYFQPVAAKSGDTFTFSDYYRSNIPSGLTIQYQLADGTFKYPDLALNLPASSGWTKFSKSFTVPAYASPVVSVSMFHYIQSVGWLETDAYDLVKQGGNGTSTPPATSTSTLLVKKHVINDNGGTLQSSDFTLHVRATTTDSVAPFAGSEAGKSIVLPAGIYTVSENAVTGYSSSFGGDCDLNGSVTLAAGASKTCTITNNDESSTSTLPADNLIPNGNLETPNSGNPSFPKGWSGSFSPGSTATFAYPVPSYDGSRAIQVTVSKYTGGSGADWYYSPVPVKGGEEYVFTNHFKSTTDSIVEIEFEMADGTQEYFDLMNLAPTDGSWKTATENFVVPQGAIGMIVFHLIDSVGTLATDDYSVTKIASAPFDEGMITLEFDDSLSNQYKNAVPILESAGINAGFYIITGSLGQSGSMTKAQVKDLAARGFEVGAHTRTHPYLTTLTQAQMENEIEGSKQDLAALGIDAKIFVYPYGDFDDVVEQEVKDAGFLASRSVREGFNTKNTNKFELVDQHIENTTTIADVKEWIDEAKASRQWLIFELHAIIANTAGDQYSATPQFLQQIVDYIKQSGIKVVTTEQGVNLMY